MKIADFKRRLEDSTAAQRGQLFDDAPSMFTPGSGLGSKAAKAVEEAVSIDMALAEVYPEKEIFRVNMLKAKRAVGRLRSTP